MNDATVTHVHDLGRGGIIVQFQQTIDGIEVFREQARVSMARDLSLVAISGFISPSVPTSTSFDLSAADAAAIAFSDLSGTTLAPGQMQSRGALDGGYEALDLSPVLKRTLAGATTQPARAKPVYFHTPDAMVPAYYVEVDSAIPGGSELYAYVISAADGSLLYRHDLTAYDVAPNAFTYRVWAFPPDDPDNPSAPFDGPHGNNLDPHPTGTLDGSQPVITLQNDVTMVSSPYVSDPWLPIGATQTIGNNVEAYVDLVNPDGFTPNSADFHADITGPNAFARTYDPNLPNDVNQQKAAIVQMFYNDNFFHDWYYASGFTEAAGNAQDNNYGRGGVAGDSLRAEGQDVSGRNNANMQTPADGGRPRMQMFLFDGIANRHLFVSGNPALASDFATGIPSGFGIASHDVTGEVVWLNDGIGSAVYPPANTAVTTIHDGCDYTPGPGGAVDPHWANVTGKIAFIDRGGTAANPAIACGFQVKAFNATQAGALGVIIASTTPHAAPAAIAMGAGTGAGNGPVTIPTYQLSTPDGDAIRAQFGPDGRGVGGPIIARLLRDPAVDRDGTIDNQVMAHEWGHYISNRLISNSNGLTTNMSGGMGEGWADFHAMLLTVKEEDAQVASNLAYNGVYALAIWVEQGGVNGPQQNQGAYFGIRRVPYSTDLSKDPETFKNIQDNSAIPQGVPLSFWPAPGTTAANGGNSEVHNTGEVWATMLWECYAALLRDTVGPTPRLSFHEARNRMKDYLVAAYKLTPPQPTFLDARDAVLAAAYASGNLADFNLFQKAFAKRGAGFGAISPDRFSATNNGVVESFQVAPNLVFVNGLVTDDVVSCDQDGNLDSGETGTLTVQLRNDTGNVLSATTATVTAIGPNATNLSFPAGTSISFPSASPGQVVNGTVRISLASGLVGVQPLDFQIQFSDAALPELGVQTALFSKRGNFDDVAAQSFTEDAESTTSDFTAVTLLPVAGAQNLVPGWVRHENSAYDHDFMAADLNGVSDVSLVSPVLNIGTSPLSISFRHRYKFDSTGATLFDGGVLEISTDGGSTWADATSFAGVTVAGQAYTGALNGGSPLGRRRAFGGQSPGYPAFVTSTFNLGTQFAGLLAGTTTGLSFRFRLGTDARSQNTGWEVDDITVAGAATRPFRALLPNKCNPAVGTGQTNRRPVAAISAQPAVPERTTVTLSGAASTDADGDALSFFWAQLSGTPVTITTPDPAHPEIVSFVAPDVPAAGGSVVMTLTVSDGTAFSATATRTVPITNVDRPPVASAGAPQTVNEESLVTLDGSGSTDPDGDALSFAWTQTGGPTVAIMGANTARPTFVAPDVGPQGASLTFSVTVTAAGVARAASTSVSVLNVNHAPSASAGPNQSVDERTVGQLHGSGLDPDGDALTYSWTQLSPAAPAVVLSSPSDAEPTFTAPEVTADTPFVFQVAVSDGIAPPVTATVTVTVRNVNRAPIAVATAPAIADERSSITLDGSSSFDPDGQPLTYSWTVASALPEGAGLRNANSALATFDTGDVHGDFSATFHLVVNDGFLDSAPASVTVVVRNLNRRPVANITAPDTVAGRDVVVLNGLGSFDPDGDAIVAYRWTQTGGLKVDLSGADTAKASFVAPDVNNPTALTFALEVSDGSALSDKASATVTDLKRRGNGRGEGTTTTALVAAAAGGCSTGGTSSFGGLFVLMGMLALRRRKKA
ncbi:MAG TPA: myxosortase-dependent M36 family metallopeptidase [Myxococcales bacterium]